MTKDVNYDRIQLSSAQLLQMQNKGMGMGLKSQGSRLKTLDDLEKIWYPWTDPNNPLFSARLKADDPVLTSTTNFLTTTYGQILWNQINMEANAWGLLPKRPWDRRGWRMIKARSATGGGMAEGGTLPETDQPDLGIAVALPKTIAHSFDVSWQAILEAQGQDDIVGDPMATYRDYTSKEHIKDMNEYLMQDFDTLAGNNIESLDRLTATNSEQAAVGATANDEDIFGIDKSANSWAEPYCDHNSNVDRALTLKMLNKLIRSTKPYWSDITGKNCIFITGHDTVDLVAELLQAQQRFMDVVIDNGVQRQGVHTRGGIEGGFDVMAYRKIPFFETIDAEQDGASRIYLIDLGHTFLKVLAPTQYFQTGVESGNPFILNTFNEQGIYVTIAELNCTMFKANGKIRDILA